MTDSTCQHGLTVNLHMLIKFEALERIHVGAAKLIYGLHLDMPTTQVLATTNWRSLKHTYLSKMLCLVYNCYYALVPNHFRTYSSSA